jgi:ABC-type nickel/cobalt efflux system permease component RcnA
VIFFRILTVFLLFNSAIFACALCKAQVPDVAVSVTEHHTQDNIELDFTWSFKTYFSAETLLAYDQDRDGKLNPLELDQVTKKLMNYLVENNYLTFIKYVKNMDAYDTAGYLDFKVSGAKTYFESDRMHFRFHLTLPQAIKSGYELYITVFDQQGFFKFNIVRVMLQEAENHSAVITGGSTSFIPLRSMKAGTSVQAHTKIQNDMSNIENNATGVLGFLGEKMQQTKTHIFDLVKQIEDKGAILAYFWLLAFSLFYGFIHALGPGHGKSLVAAYFLGNNRSLVKAFSIASLIGVVHTFSAFLLTFMIYFVLNTYLSTYFADLESVTIKISAMIIIFIALYLLYKKIPKKKKQQPLWSTSQPNQHASSCGCGACQSRSTDLGIILSAGIVPCPGTITIFVFSLSLSAYLIGFLSAVFMSIGMSLVIFSAALISIKVRQKSTSNHLLRTILDYGSILFILMLGVVLFFMA